HVAISLVGGTGAGKSTLLNALIGARVLPVSNMRACTAAVCEVTYADGPYRARVEFIPRSSWANEVRLLLADLRDTQSAVEEADNGLDLRFQMSRRVWDKLRTVYSLPEGDSQSSFDPFALIEPQEVKEALDSGSATIECADLKEFREEVSRYLDSRHRFWPI